ncbi:microprocessor complex subunit DGCR8-like isoform X2 [Tubulanus polymorphus]|uniref:microprocessor complex subunit DGCR8-like isoform X2 n=1 Tax=Tubulanus polymorphus TaxID=672921 RepID=UPI003DA43B86
MDLCDTECELTPPIPDNDNHPPPLPETEICQSPPPLPGSPDHLNFNPPLPTSPLNFSAPPLPMQMSNQSNEGLDFACGDTGKVRHIETPPPLSVSPESVNQRQQMKKRPDDSSSEPPPPKRIRADSESGCLALQNIIQNVNEELTRNKNRELSRNSSSDNNSIYRNDDVDLITAMVLGSRDENQKDESLNETNISEITALDLSQIATSHDEVKSYNEVKSSDEVNEEKTNNEVKLNDEVKSSDEVNEKTNNEVNEEMSIDEKDTTTDELESTFIEEDENQTNDDAGDDYDEDDDDSDEGVDPEEIDAMLESAIGNVNNSTTNEDGSTLPIEKTKVVLMEKGHDPFEVLPEGWISVTHMSGMPIYLHKQSRVVSLSKPYFLGPGSARKHAIPTAAIPCLQYTKALDKEKQEAENGVQQFSVNSENENSTDETPKNAAPDMRPKIASGIKVETAEQRQKEMLLEPLQVRQYCQKLFHFKTVTVQRFKTWKDRRKYQYKKKHQSQTDTTETSASTGTAIPSLPQNTKLITCPVLVDHSDNKKRKEFVLNPSGKSYVCILHEYAQQSMRVQPKYTFKELENIHTPYSATVVLDGVEYGFGLANSKKNAKAEAAKNTLAILMPQLVNATSDKTEEEKPGDLSFFDQIKIEDPRIFDLCNKAGQPSPYQILLECLQRNYGFGDGTKGIKVEMKNMKHKLSEFTMTVGKHTATVLCKNKREGKQLGAQAILQKLHPHISKMGSLLRLYGRDIQRNHTLIMEETRGVTALQHKASSNRPNYAILERLQSEMLKLKAAQDEKRTPQIDTRELPKSVTIVDI